MAYTDYYKSADTDEDIYIQTLLQISNVNSRSIDGFRDVHNSLTVKYNDTKSACMREQKKPYEYREKLLDVLNDFQKTYSDICDKHNLLDTPISNVNPITYGVLFNAIAHHAPSPKQEEITENLRQKDVQARQEKIAKQEKARAEAIKRHREQEAVREAKNNRPTDQTQQANHTVYNSSTITEQMILDAAQNHFDKYKKDHGVGRWPSCKDFSTISTWPLKGESWGTIDKHLRVGGRGLAGGSSLSQLLEDNGLGPSITVDDIITAARQHYTDIEAITGTGKWPSSSDDNEITSGSLEGKSWKGVNTALIRGYYGLPSDTSLSKLLKEHGCYDDNTLSMDDIIAAAKLHYKETKEKTGRGKWPSSKDNTEISNGPLAGEKWASIHTAIRDGHRGLSPYKGGLPSFLKDNDCYDRPMTKQDIILSCIYYKENNPDNKWPTNKVKERINDDSILHGMSWSAVDKRKVDGMTLNQIIKEHENSPELYEATKPIKNISYDAPPQTDVLSL